MTNQRFEVSAQWMKACGYGDQAKVFEFDPAKTQYFPWAGEGFRNMLSLRRENGSVWIVAEGRGRYVLEGRKIEP